MEDFGAINGSEINALAIAQTRVVFADKSSSTIAISNNCDATRRATVGCSAAVVIVSAATPSTRSTFASNSDIWFNTVSSAGQRASAGTASTIIVAANGNAASLSALRCISTIAVLHTSDLGWVKMGKADKNHVVRMAYQNRLMRVDSANRRIMLPNNDRSMLVNREKRQGS